MLYNNYQLKLFPSNDNPILNSGVVEGVKPLTESLKTLNGFHFTKDQEIEKTSLFSARSKYLGSDGIDFNSLVSDFNKWRSTSEYLVLEREEDYKKRYFAVKCSKRGNDVYISRVRKRLKPLLDCEDIEFFNPKDRGFKTTSAIFVSLTFDTKLGSFQDSWGENGFSFNKWVTNLREKYGKVSFIRTWEGTKKGYSHVHGLLVFHSHKFRVFKRGYRFRIQDKKSFESSWNSNVDVQGCSSLKKASQYIVKYITKAFTKSDDGVIDGKGDLSLALNWLFGKRSFAVSRDLIDLIRSSLHNSKSKFQSMLNLVQSTFDNDVISIVWKYIGVFSSVKLGFNQNYWFKELSKPSIEIDKFNSFSYSWV